MTAGVSWGYRVGYRVGYRRDIVGYRGDTVEVLWGYRQGIVGYCGIYYQN